MSVESGFYLHWRKKPSSVEVKGDSAREEDSKSLDSERVVSHSKIGRNARINGETKLIELAKDESVLG